MKKIQKTHNKYTKKNYCYCNLLQNGKYGIKNLNFLRLNEFQIKSLEWIILKKLRSITHKNSYKLWNNFFLNLNLTHLPLESRMGKGKGPIVSKAIFIKPGYIIFEFDKINKSQIKILFNFIVKKFPGKIKLI